MTDSTDIKTSPDHWLSNSTYDRLKWIVQIILPAAGTLYAGLAIFWGFPNATEVVGSITLLATFFGAVLGLSSRSFNNSESKFDGNLIVDTSDPVKDVFSFEVNVPVDQLKAKDVLMIKVAPPSDAGSQ